MEIKKYLKKNIFLTVVLLTALTKVLEWAGQYFIFNSLEIFKNFWYIQLGFILTVAVILFIGFNYIGIKKKNYLLIPVLAYFLKELYNFIFVYGRIFNQVTLIALILEPLMLYGIILTLNKYWLRLK